MKIFSMLFLFSLSFLNVFGDEIIKYNGKRLNISKEVFILEDESKSLKEEDIAKGLYDNEFKVNKSNLLYLWNNNATYYIKLKIQNFSKIKRLSLYGWFGPISLTRTDISIIYFDNGRLVKSKFSRKINIDDEKDLLNYGFASFNAFPSEVKTIYIKTKPSITTPLILNTFENIVREERIYFFITSMFIGISLLVLLVILGFYLKLGKKYLLHYVLVCIFTYMKSNLFIKFLRNYISYDMSNKVYAIAVMFYIFFLVNFVIDILKLSKTFANIKSALNVFKYIITVMVFNYTFNIIDYGYFNQTREYIYLALFTLTLYVSIKRYKDSWFYKAFLFSWIPQWALYVYINAADKFKLKIIPFDLRIEEYLEIFANLLLIAGILLYDAKELWREKNTLEDQEELMKILNYADNLMHAMITLVHWYKKSISYNKVVFFRRKIDRENENVLHYDFSISPILGINERREEEKRYFGLARHLHRDAFNEYYICEDIENSELYRTLIEGYKSFIALRLILAGGELGYILILNNNKVEYEYNEVVKDFRYKASLLVQHFKSIDEVKERYGSIVVEETLRNFHIEVLRDAEKDIASTLQQLGQIRQLSDKYIVDKDVSVRRVLNMFYDNLERLMIGVTEDLRYEPAMKTKNKLLFKYKLIEEMLNNIQDVVKKTTNKINVSIVSNVDSNYELYGHIKIVSSILQHYISYLYNKIIKEEKECNITIVSSLYEGKLKIHTTIEGMNTIDNIKKEYISEVHKALLGSIRSKLDLKLHDDTIEITYLLDVLTKEEKKKFNITHLDYDDVDEEEEPKIN